MNLLFYAISIPGRDALPLTASLVKINSTGDGSVGNEGAVEGKSSRTEDTVRVIGPTAAGGAIGGGIGGGKGAGIGAGVGAAVGLGSVFMTRGKDLEMRKGATMEISLDRPLPVPLEGD
jgi:outer membrane lipoprotein SlyB